MKKIKKIIPLLAILLSVLALNIAIIKAQSFSVDTILYNGNPNKFINIVFLGDGYQMHEQTAFTTHANNSSNYLFSISPFSMYKNYFNVFAIKVTSAESGADHPRTAPDCPPASQHPVLSVNTYFNSTFDYYAIHRLLVATNNGGAYSVLLNNFPLYDQPLMLVNTPYYGGSGGWLATASLDAASNEVMVHEIGHSFAELADEYWAGDMYAAEKANMTQQSDPSLVKWKNWIGYNNVDVYRYGTTGTAANWYRPHNFCKMRYLNYPFCPVCQEAIALKIMEKFGTPILSYSPMQSSITLNDDSLQFGLQLAKPIPNTIRTKWLLNGAIINLNNDTIIVYSHQLQAGNNTLVVEVLDTTALIRKDDYAMNNTYVVNWNINRNTTEVKIADLSDNLRVYPNPVTDNLTIELNGNNKKIRFEILNAAGQLIYYGVIIDKAELNVKNYKVGAYVIKLENGNTCEFRKILKE